MPEGHFDILLEEKQAAEAPACQFFFPFFEVLHCQSTRTRPQKKENCGTVILCCGKGKNVLQVFVACYITLHLKIFDGHAYSTAEDILKQNHQIWGDSSCKFCEVSKKRHLCFLSTEKNLTLKKKAAEVREALIFFQFLLEMLPHLYTCFLNSYTSLRIRK